MVFPGLAPPSALDLAGHVLETFGEAGKKVALASLKQALAVLFKNKLLTDDPPTVAHSAITKTVYDLLKVSLGN